MKTAYVLMLAIFGSFFSFGIGKFVCYGKYGCFSDSKPFNIPKMKLPQSPEEIGTKFRLYTRENPENGHELDDSDASKLASSHYNIARRTIIMCHGWTECSSGYYNWGLRMRDALLKKGDFNVIMTDWSVGANQDLGVSSGNTRLVGAQMAELVKFLIYQNGKSKDFADNFYLIGFSLGAHVTGFAGSYLQRNYSMTIGRITGLDPAMPLFTGSRKDVHLDKTDAKYVDIIHTNMGEFGTPDKEGDADFLPNGGALQPGCVDDPTDVMFTVGCNHLRSTEFYIKTVTEECPKPFKGYPCSSYYRYFFGRCNDCGKEGCPLMGFRAEETYPEGEFYLQTGPMDTLCPK
ncbi:pancreatic lipase-related protein 2-like [Montipora foliosa]|uniref:pancreatic lipase-related protein 2-like n=1 Tax=Montipora foliosa TaxID=591990 RepID=UPI0035F18232